MGDVNLTLGEKKNEIFIELSNGDKFPFISSFHFNFLSQPKKGKHGNPTPRHDPLETNKEVLINKREWTHEV